jgi:hypothetical protein
VKTTPKGDDDSVYDGLTPRSMQLRIYLSLSSEITWQFAMFCFSSLDKGL